MGLQLNIDLGSDIGTVGRVLLSTLDDQRIISSHQLAVWQFNLLTLQAGCCVNASYICVSLLIFILCFVSLSTVFHSLLYSSSLFRSFLFKRTYHLCSYSMYLKLSIYFFFHDVFLRFENVHCSYINLINSAVRSKSTKEELSNPGSFPFDGKTFISLAAAGAGLKPITFLDS